MLLSEHFEIEQWSERRRIRYRYECKYETIILKLKRKIEFPKIRTPKDRASCFDLMGILWFCDRFQELFTQEHSLLHVAQLRELVLSSSNALTRNRFLK